MSVAPLAVRAPRWALPLAPSPSERRPAAAHSRPEVRTTRPRAPPGQEAKAARLRAFGTALRDSPLRFVPKHRRLAAVAGTLVPPSAAKASGPAQEPGTEPGGKHRARKIGFAPFGADHEGCFRLPDTRAVICNAAPLPYTADAGAPRQTGPRRLIARPPAAGATQSALRRPGALKITASCVQRPLRAWHESLLAAGCPDPAPPPAPQCSRQSLRHPSRQPLSPLS